MIFVVVEKAVQDVVHRVKKKEAVGTMAEDFLSKKRQGRDQETCKQQDASISFRSKEISWIARFDQTKRFSSSENVPVSHVNFA
jgi:hypothetical protein